MARMIRTATRDGAELVEYALAVFRDPAASERSRVDMHAWLSDRGFGKPLQSVEIGGDIDVMQAMRDVAKLSDEELIEAARVVGLDV